MSPTRDLAAPAYPPRPSPSDPVARGKELLMLSFMRARLIIPLALCLACCATPRPVLRPPHEHLSGAAARALARAEPDLDRARLILESAIAHDPFDGASYNNLGAAYFAAGRLRDAALAFSEARRLLPGAPEPRANLAMALERSGLFDPAIEAYQAALECDPRHWPALVGLARLESTLKTPSPQRAERLALIARDAPDPAWRAWAAAGLNP